MTMMTLTCPKCSAVAKLSLADPDYVGPRRCWKCHEFFTITIHNNQLTSCEPLRKEDYERQQEAKKATEKSGGGTNFSRQAQLEFPQTASEQPQGGTDSSKQEDTDIFQILAGKSKGGIDFSSRQAPDMPQKPPEKPRSGINFSRREEPAMPQNPTEKQPVYSPPLNNNDPLNQSKSEKPSSVFPPDRIQTFVPFENIREEPQKPKKPKDFPERRQDSPKSLNNNDPLNQSKSEKPSSVFPPDRIQTFVPFEDIKEEPKKPKKTKDPPERFNTFIPPAT